MATRSTGMLNPDNPLQPPDFAIVGFFCWGGPERSSDMRVVAAVVVLIFIMAVPASACWITMYRPDGMLSAGPSDWDPFDGESLGLGSDLPGRTVAFQFKPYRTAEFYGGWIGLTCLDGPCQFEVELREDTANYPGGLIESFLLLADFGSYFDSQVHPVLSGDAPYWLVAREPSGNPSLWGYNLTGFGRMAFQHPPYEPMWVGFDNQRMGDFIIYGQPEPGSGTLVLGGLALLVFGVWRRRRSLKPRTH